jgi:hypothetical protein
MKYSDAVGVQAEYDGEEMRGVYAIPESHRGAIRSTGMRERLHIERKYLDINAVEMC